MDKPARYDAVQWAAMTSPEGQRKIRDGLHGYLRSFLDTPPEGKPLERVHELLVLLKDYFEHRITALKNSAPDDLEQIELQTSIETVVLAIEGAMLMVPTDADRRKQFDAVLEDFRRADPVV